MTILGILLTILKIIGIILLVLLLVILAIILLVLCVPIRYKVHADKVGWDLNAGANVSWLLHMISVDVGYGIRESGYGGGLTKDIRIFGISIFKVKDWLASRKKKKAEGNAKASEEAAPSGADLPTAGAEIPAKTEDTGTQDASSAAGTEAAQEDTAQKETAPPSSAGTETVQSSGSGAPPEYASTSYDGYGPEADEIYESQERAAAEDAQTEVRQSPIDRLTGIITKALEFLISLPGNIFGFILNIFMRILEIFTAICGIPGKIVVLLSSVIDKILTIHGKITLITDFFFDDRTQDAIHLLLGKVGHLLGHIRPRTLSGYLDFGFDDPSITGRVLGGLSLFLPQCGKTFDINPDFEKAYLECDINSSGRIYLIYLVYIALSTYFNKNIKYVLRYVKHLRKELSQA